jgi:hypothetical protein
MRKPWHKSDPSVFDHLKGELSKKYPDLAVIATTDDVRLRGSFPVLHEETELARFQIEILIPSDFPDSIPLVREIAGRVPHAVDWHTYNKGALCVIVPEEWLLNPKRTSLMAFLEGPLRNYFLNHALAECGMKRPMGERSHGSLGLLEAYGEWFGSNELRVVRAYLNCLSKEMLRGHWDCPCGSGVRLRKCHFSKLMELQKQIPVWIAAKALKRLDDQIERERAGSFSK